MVTEQAVRYSELPIEDIKWSSVPLSEVINSGNRLEASVFGIEGRRARDVVVNNKWGSTLLYGKDGLATAYTCGRFKRIWLDRSALPIYQPSSITDIKPTPDGFLSRLTKTNLEALRVRKGQILLTCSGTIGKIALVSDTLDGEIFSHDLIRLDVKKPSDIGYVYAFLRSNIGNALIKTSSYGAVIQHIEPEHLANIPIPNSPEPIKARINDAIVKSYESRDESNVLIDKATTLLMDELKLPPLNDFSIEYFDEDAEAKTFSVRSSDLIGRLDASYHIPIVAAIKKHISKYASEVTTIGDKRVSKDIILPGRFKRVYVGEKQGRVFFGGKQIRELDPTNKKYLSLVHHGERIKKQLELRKNMTLVTRSGTIGKVNIVPKHWECWVASDHIIRIEPANTDIAGYLYAFLASDYGHILISRFTYGSVVDEIDANHVSKIFFPLLKNIDVQNEINCLVLKANGLRYEAYLHEQEAMKILDEEVFFV